MGHERWDVDEVPLAGLGNKLQPIAPPQAGNSVYHVDDALEVSVMVGAGFGFGLNGDCAGPEFCGAGALGRYSGTPLHPESLCRAIVQLIVTDDPYTAGSPPAGALSHGAL